MSAFCNFPQYERLIGGLDANPPFSRIGGNGKVGKMAEGIKSFLYKHLIYKYKSVKIILVMVNFMKKGDSYV